MFLKGKNIAFGAILLSLTIILLFAGNLIPVNTLFFTAAASFLIGAVVLQSGLGMAVVFFVAALALGFILIPNKLNCLTYGMFALYILASEWVYYFTAKWNKGRKKTVFIWSCKYIVFNVLYIPVILFFPKLIMTRSIEGNLFLAVLVAGEALVLVFDFAYVAFQKEIWGPVRKRLKI